MNQLKDIKPIVSINDDSLTYFLIIIGITLLIATFVYWKVKRVENSNSKKIALEKLQKLDFSNSKMTAYDFKKYGEVLCTDENKPQFDQINNNLEQYKYKKQVGKLDLKLIEKIKDFIHV